MVRKRCRKFEVRASSGTSRPWRPNQSFEYTSGCPLTMPFGSMHGTYQMINDRKQQFDIEIAPFTLTEPYSTVN